MKRCIFSFSLFIIGCQNLQIIDLNGKTMGTTYSISIVNKSGQSENSKLLQAQIDSILIDVNNIFSNYIESSELSSINRYRSKKPIDISEEMEEVLIQAAQVYKASKGKFDVTVRPLVDIWGFGPEFNTFQIPSSDLLNETKKYVGFEKILLKNQMLQKLDTLIQIDLNAIAKGWGVDIIAAFIKTVGYTNYMVEIGGEISVSGKNKYNNDWEIGILLPENLESQLFSTITITNLSVATSGTYNNYFTIDSVNYTHIIDPDTGYPIKHDLVSVTIVAEKCSFADAIATSVMVMGFNEGLHFINSLPNVECLLIQKSENGNYTSGKSDGFSY